jgi:hypothetical protein
VFLELVMRESAWIFNSKRCIRKPEPVRALLNVQGWNNTETRFASAVTQAHRVCSAVIDSSLVELCAAP